MILVTGGAGFIGSAVVRRLASSGETVRILDNFSSGLRSNLDLPGIPLDVVGADVTDPEAVALALRGVSAVIHLAAIPSVSRSVENPGATWRANVDGTLRLLEGCRDAGVKRFVFTSSSSVYGDTEVLPKHEGLPAHPLSPYAASKAAGEALVSGWDASFGLSTATLRPFNVYGPRQNPRSEYAAAIPRFVTAALEGRPAVIYGDGSQTRDFTYVEDVAELFVRAARSTVRGVFNAAAGGRISIRDLVERIRELCGGPAPVFEPRRAGDVVHSQADPSAAGRAFDWKAAVGLDEGLRRTVEWFRGPAGGR